jgi:hypothetical protein
MLDYSALPFCRARLFKFHGPILISTLNARYDLYRGSVIIEFEIVVLTITAKFSELHAPFSRHTDIEVKDLYLLFWDWIIVYSTCWIFCNSSLFSENNSTRRL